VYKYTARGLFERHKLLLSLQMCVRILQTANQVSMLASATKGRLECMTELASEQAR
jgi:hypothetical protein